MTSKKHTEEDDVVIEEEAGEETSFKKKPEDKLKKELREAKQQAQEYLDGWQRAKADLINFKKESEEKRVAQTRYATEDLVAQLIPVLDSFDMAFRDTTAWEQAPENWRKGIEYIHAQLLSVLRDNHLEPVTPVGERFDPSQHDSAGTENVDTQEREGIILSVAQKGYRLHGKLIRAPKVIVGHYQS